MEDADGHGRVRLDRRAVLGLGLGLGAAGLAGWGRPAAAQVRTQARIVIAGAGAAGLSMASRLAAGLEGAAITLVDGRAEHHYQPGYTLVGAGVRPPSYVLSRTRDYVPRGVTLIEEAAAEIDPEANTVVTASGQRLPYDYLVVATGLELNYAGIEGMDVGLIGTNGIGSVYAGAQAARATYEAMSAFADRGGVALFGRPPGEMKCAGAPLKYAFIVEDILTRRGTRAGSELIYHAHNTVLFGVPIVSERVRMLYDQRGIGVRYEHVLKAVDPGRRIATYATPQGDVEQGWDFIHVVPPMRAVPAVRNSPLPWREGNWAADGYLEVDRATLRHVRYPNVFAVGDTAGVPKGKTAASVKWQVPVVTDHLVADLAGRQSGAAYDGYTSCPLITRIGRAMLIEFDYNDNLVPSFPGLIAPLEELWIPWVMKETALKATYVAMLRGRA
ncbi:NAD(P)/FAD-dependent oxidoreductase [Rubellimicrobium sp. CFH 75288]|uniref:NAD(P)/FAD-dependent oxidoreductase n=1 Tax=Rubellimicrobium sp. CFH 75288 TaxID=2697034 RepID=UPI0014132C02|nr:FAD/NAD(P)-binding oxidoreductase [Rubellimicrobium sp. CFH 75288]NAZ35361.1 FAD-dependent oxidoreductase [Rubellimicrobium sp. CFH 75288]